MPMNTRKAVELVATVLLAMPGLATSANAQTAFRVTVNTTPLKGQIGNLDFQFNPGGVDALAAMASISSFVTDGTPFSTSVTSGGASGAVPGPPAPVITNSTGFNDLFQGFTFGTVFSFRVEFAGQALSPGALFPTAGSTFALSFFDAPGVVPLLTTSPDGSLFHIDVNSNGTLSRTVFLDQGGISRTVIATDLTATPEPSSLSLILAPVFVTLFLLKRKHSSVARSSR